MLGGGADVVSVLATWRIKHAAPRYDPRHRLRPRGLTSPRRWARMAAAYERYRDAQGRLPATIEMVFGQAWAPDPATRRASDGETSFPLSRLGVRR